MFMMTDLVIIMYVLKMFMMTDGVIIMYVLKIFWRQKLFGALWMKEYKSTNQSKGQNVARWMFISQNMCEQGESRAGGMGLSSPEGHEKENLFGYLIT